MDHALKAVGRFEVSVIRQGVEIFHDFLNGITTPGLNKLLDVMFRNQTQSPTWYAGLIDGVGYTAVSPTDTMGSHAGWTETVAYIEADRQTWGVGAAASKSISNSVNMQFTINADGTQVAGIFIADNSTKGGTSGLLWCTGLFSTIQNFLTDDLVKVKYTVTLAN